MKNTRDSTLNSRTVLASLTLLILVSSPQRGNACDAFSIKEPRELLKPDVVVAKNFDWGYGHGLIVANKRGLHKTALAGTAEWTARYGSITFDQVSRELPQGGVNEAGLVVEVMWLDSAQYPPSDARLSVNELQWVQYQLDNYGSTQEVLDHLLAQDLRIAKAVATVHYLVCDKRGQCAAVDPVAGLMRTYSRSTLSFPLQTNSTYPDAVAFANQTIQSNGCDSIPNSHNSLDRYARIACSLENPEWTPALRAARGAANRAFAILGSVAGDVGQADADSGDVTQWSIVYDLTQMKIHVKTHDTPTAKTIDIRGFDYSCSKPDQILDVNFPGTGAGAVNRRFTDYTAAAENQIVEKSLVTGYAHLPPAAIQRIESYPDTIVCQDAR